MIMVTRLCSFSAGVIENPQKRSCTGHGSSTSLLELVMELSKGNLQCPVRPEKGRQNTSWQRKSPTGQCYRRRMADNLGFFAFFAVSRFKFVEKFLKSASNYAILSPEAGRSASENAVEAVNESIYVLRRELIPWPKSGEMSWRKRVFSGEKAEEAVLPL